MNNQTSVNLVMPMGGRGSRFSEKGYFEPKPLIKINGKPFFYWATQSIRAFLKLESLTFVVLKEHTDNYSIDKKILEYFPEAGIVVLPEVLEGPVLTCIEGLKAIKNDNPIIFNDCDHIFHSRSFYDFCKSNDMNSSVDGALLSFNSKDAKFSYLKYNDAGFVIKTVEKQVISNNAICGAYYFKNKNVFLETSKRYLVECNYSEYFISGLYNIMAENGGLIKSFNVDFHLPFGTPEEYDLATGSALFKVVE